MKKLRLVISMMFLCSCSTNQPILAPTETTKSNINYVQLAIDNEKNNDNKALKITNDISGNIYIIFQDKKIIKIDKANNTFQNTDNIISSYFFEMDSKGHGFFIPLPEVDSKPIITFESDTEYPIYHSKDTLSIYTIENARIKNEHEIMIQDGYRFNCLSADDCSDLTITVESKTYSLNDLLKSGKSIINTTAKDSFPILSDSNPQ